jgi:hypothetical protein
MTGNESNRDRMKHFSAEMSLSDVRTGPFIRFPSVDFKKEMNIRLKVAPDHPFASMPMKKSQGSRKYPRLPLTFSHP